MVTTGALIISRRSLGMRGRHANRWALRLFRRWLTWRWDWLRFWRNRKRLRQSI